LALSIDDIDFGGDDIIYKTLDTGRKSKPDLTGILTKLGEFTNLKLWSSGDFNTKTYKIHYTINVLGYETDAQIFEYFWNVLNATVTTEFKRYKNTKEYRDHNRNYQGRSIRKAFMTGLMRKVNDKLDDRIEENRKVVTSNGTAIVA